MKNHMIIISVIACLLSLTIIQAAEEVKSGDGDDLDPINNIEPEVLQQSGRDKPNKRTILQALQYDNYGWAKHIKHLSNGQKIVLGYTPVDLKYVPVIKPIGKNNGWRFKPKRPVMRPPAMVAPWPKPDAQGWKPITPAHVPPPSSGGGHWTTTKLKPVRPSAPDHDSHHLDHGNSLDHHHVHHGLDQPQFHSLDHHHHVHNLDHHHVPVDHHHQVLRVPIQHPHIDYPTQLVYPFINPLPLPLPVTKPDLPVLPLDATFPLAAHAAQLQFPHPSPSPALFPLPLGALGILGHVHLQPPYGHIHSGIHEVPAPHFHSVPAPVDYIHPYNYHHHDAVLHQLPQTYQVHEPHVDVVLPAPSPFAAPNVPSGGSVEYHGHAAHLIAPAPNQQQYQQNAHQYAAEQQQHQYQDGLLPGSTGALSENYLNPGYTDLQIPEHLPERHAYLVGASSENYSHYQHVGQPATDLESPIN